MINILPRYIKHNSRLTKTKPMFIIEVAEGNSEMAQQRLEDMACLNVAAIAALTHLPVQATPTDSGKRKVP